MDPYRAGDALRAMDVHLPGAPLAALAAPAAIAWDAQATWVDRMAAVVAVTWTAGFRYGARQGHTLTATSFHDAAMHELARMQRDDVDDPAAHRLLWEVAGSAQTVAGQESTCTDSGPSRRDYQAAIVDDDPYLAVAYGTYMDLTPEFQLAKAARVGWINGHTAGRADATWSAAGAVISAATRSIGASAVQVTTVAGMSGAAWLEQVERAAAATAAQTSPGSQALSGAFPQMTTVAATGANTPRPLIAGGAPLCASRPMIR